MNRTVSCQSFVQRAAFALGATLTCVGLLAPEALAQTQGSPGSGSGVVFSPPPNAQTGVSSSPTPTPATAPLMVATPTAVVPGQFPSVAQPSPTASTGVASPSAIAAQNDANQIQAISQQIQQMTQDPGIPADIKSQLITGLAAQFNRLVITWQQDAGAASGVQLATSPGAATPASLPTSTLPTSAVPTPGQTVDQLRAQAINVAQQMNAVSADPTLAGDAKTSQLNALALQFNQIMVQLQQAGAA